VWGGEWVSRKGGGGEKGKRGRGEEEKRRSQCLEILCRLDAKSVRG
jgi:hypothetical protein